MTTGALRVWLAYVTWPIETRLRPHLTGMSRAPARAGGGLASLTLVAAVANLNLVAEQESVEAPVAGPEG